MARTWARLLTADDLGAFVLDLRIARNLTQQELAEEIGVRRQFVHEIEAGKHTLHQDRLFALLRALGARLSVEANVADPPEQPGHVESLRDGAPQRSTGSDTATTSRPQPAD